MHVERMKTSLHFMAETIIFHTKCSVKAENTQLIHFLIFLIRLKSLGAEIMLWGFYFPPQWVV